MSTKKRKMTTTALAVVLAVLLLIGGGTFAYLQSTSKDVKNNFSANKVTVDLSETTGNDYNIVPGTTEKKDPTVTVNATVDAYVYVEVTDTTKGLVGYEIADGWMKLDGYDNVFYREVTGRDAGQSFPVLKNNQVTYDEALENSDMLTASGKLKTGIQLTFRAHAMQKEGFADAKAAYENVPVEAGTVTNVNKLLQSGRAVKLTASTNGNATIVASGGAKSTLDLNGHTVKGISQPWGDRCAITANGDGTVLTIKGEGTVRGASKSGTAQNVNNAVRVDSGATIIIKGGTYTTGLDYKNNYNAVILANGGTAVIEGGFFYNYQNHNEWVLNCQDNVAGSAIIVKGGTFVNFDPSNNKSDGENTNYVAAGYTVKSETKDNGDIWYTVVKDN